MNGVHCSIWSLPERSKIFAVLRLKISSSFVAFWKGKSVGFGEAHFTQKTGDFEPGRFEDPHHQVSKERSDNRH
jgi:hypothetical protein